MRDEDLPISKGIHQRLLPAGEIFRIIELPCVPHNLIPVSVSFPNIKSRRATRDIIKVAYITYSRCWLATACGNRSVEYGIARAGMTCLGHSNRMSGWTGGTRENGTARCIGHMALVIWAVQILAIPARRKDDRGPDTSGAHLCGEGGSVASVTRRSAVAVYLGGSVTAVTDSWERAGLAAECRVAGDHSETLFRC